MFRRCHLTMALPLIALVAMPAHAGAPEESSTDVDALQALWDELEAIEADQASMRGNVDDLRERLGDNWLDASRAFEIRGIVDSVLADTDTRVSMLQSGLVAGWDNGFFLSDPNGAFSLHVEGLMQFRYAFNFHDTAPRPLSFGEQNAGFQNRTVRDRRGMEVNRNQLTFRGTIGRPELTFLARTDFTRDNDINPQVDGLFFARDLWIRYAFNDSWILRIGQFKLPFNREELVSSSRQIAVERSLVNERLGGDFSQGVELTWASERRRVSFAWTDGFRDKFGIQFNLTGRRPENTNALAVDSEFAWTVRYEELLAGNWAQFADMTSPPGTEYGMLFGAAVHYETDESTDAMQFGGRDETPVVLATTDLSVEYGGASLFLSGMFGYADNRSFDAFTFAGAVVQASTYLTPKFEAFIRYEWAMAENNNLDAEDLSLPTIGAVYYFDGHDAKWTTDFMIGLEEIGEQWAGTRLFPNRTNTRIDPDSAMPQIVIRSQIQLTY